MDVIASLFSNLALGFETAVSLQNLTYCFIGVFVGTLVGVLPGIGPLAAIAMLLPATFNLPPVGALIMLAGIYYGTQYGGSTTSILVNLPGESASVVTCIDGYQMAKNGRAGPALAIAADRFVLRRHRGYDFDRGRRTTAGRDGAEIRCAGVFLADVHGPDRFRRARQRFDAEGHIDDFPRPAVRHRRHRRQFGDVALHLRHVRTGGRSEFRRCCHGSVRLRRDPVQP